MVTMEEIKVGVVKSLQDSSVDSSTIEGLINMGVRYVSEKVRLPSLDSSGTLDITSDASFVDIPDSWNYQRGLYDVVAGGRRVLTIYPSLMSVRRVGGISPVSQEGTTVGVYIAGGKLHYFQSSTETLSCRFFSNPPILENDTDELTCIPGGFAKVLIESFVLQFLWSIIEDGNEGSKVNTIFNKTLFENYLGQLNSTIESGQPAPEQVRYNYWKI